MKSYPISDDFKKYRRMNPPITKRILPCANFVISLISPGAGSDKAYGTKREYLKIPVDGGEMDAILFTPEKARPEGCLVYFHGGGFIMKAAPQHYSIARTLAASVPCRVLFADYRLSPEFPFPVPAEDCLSAYKWAIENTKKLGGDRIAVGGDSAGANLAAAVSLLARDRNLTPPVFQMLLYPVIDRRMETGSMKEFVDTPMWNAPLSALMWSCYLPDGDKTPSLRYASLTENADKNRLRALPDAYIETAEFDCLRDEGAEFAKALADAGNNVEFVETKGTMHGFDIAEKSETVKECMKRRCAALSGAFTSRARN